MARVNLLAVLAVALGIYSVTANADYIGSALWLAGAGAGAVVVIAWCRDRTIGVWFVAASMTLGSAELFIAGPRTPNSLALTSGACAGMLAAFAWVAARRRIKH